MAERKKIEIEWDEEIEKRIEKKIEKWAKSFGSKGCKSNSATGGIVYCLGFIGSVYYYIQHATDFWNGALGILKALVWPAIIVYKALEFFGM